MAFRVDIQDTHEGVYSHRCRTYEKVRKGGDFFYGKSTGNENSFKGL